MLRTFGFTCMLSLALAPAALAVRQEPTVVLLVRHAERAAEPRTDPGLSPEGELRARSLAAMLADARVAGIITTQYQRTRLTAAPLAQALGITPEVFTAGGSGGTAGHAQGVADLVRQRFTGRVVVVVGHSNTLAPIIAALGGPRLDDLCDHEFSPLLTLVLRNGGEASLIRGRYGAADGAPPASCTRSLMMERTP